MRFFKYRDYIFGIVILLMTFFYWDILKGMVLLIMSDYLSYSHNILVPFIFAFFVFFKREDLKQCNKEFSIYGLIFIIFSFAITTFAIIFKKYATLNASYFINVIALVVLFYGIDVFKILFFPFLFLLLIVPIPYHYIQSIIEPVTRYERFVSTKISALFLKILFVPVFSSDFAISIPNYKFKVGMYCSGLNYVISLILVSSIFMYITKGNFLKKFILFLMIFPIAIVSNILRIVLNVLIAYYISISIADVFFLFFSGIFFSVVAFILFFIIALSLGLRVSWAKGKKYDGLKDKGEANKGKGLVCEVGGMDEGSEQIFSKEKIQVSKNSHEEETHQDDIFTIEEVSKMLNLSVSSIQRRIETGRIKCFKKDDKIIFYRRNIDEYLRKKWLERNWWKITLGSITAISFLVILFYLLTFLRNVMWGNAYIKNAEENIKNKDFFTAAINLKEAIRLKPKDNELKMKLAKVLGALGDEQQMQSYLLDILKADPENIEAMETLAFYYYKNGSLDYAEKECKKILSLMPNHFFANNLLGLIKASQGKFESAINYFEKVLEIRPNFSPALKNIADIYSLQMHYMKSIQTYEKSNLKDLTTKLNKAITLEKSNQKKQALEIYNEIIELSPIISRAYNNLAWMIISNQGDASLLADLNSLEKAFDFARIALLLNPEDGSVHDTVGWIFFLMGRYRESEKYLTYASELLPENPLVYVHLAMLYERKGKKKVALEKLRKAEKLSGKVLPYVKKSLQALIGNLKKSLADEIKAEEEKARKRKERLEEERKRQKRAEKKVKEKSKKTKR